ncbi:MAG: putative sugar O-methyltransferase [bacterium]|nr:putative sugar O-methyltransferase [bacterium]
MRHDWDRCWAKKEAAFRKTDWRCFRRDAELMGGIQTRVPKLNYFWNRCEAEGVPMEWRRDSLVGDPEGRTRFGVFVTATSLKMAYYLHRITQLWLPPERPRVLEIGGGFGGMARTLNEQLGPVERYVLVDGQPCLDMQRLYLSELYPGEGAFEFVRYDETLMLYGQEFDLVLNMASLSEMTPEIVEEYFNIIEDVMEEGGAFYHLNRNSYPNGQRVNVPASSFPYDDWWELRMEPDRDADWWEVLAVRTSHETHAKRRANAGKTQGERMGDA